MEIDSEQSNINITNPLVSIVIVSWNIKDDIAHTLNEYRKACF